MVRGHVGEHARLVGLVAHPAQDEAAARGLEDGDVDVVPAEDDLGAARARPVAGLDHPLVDQDAVRRRRPDVAPGPQQDVGDQPGHRRLAVGAGDRDGRDAARVVADPRGRGGTRLARFAPASRRASAAWVPVRRARRAGETLAVERSKAASAIRRARSAPATARSRPSGPASELRWTSHGPPCSAWSARRRRVQATRSVDRVGPVAAPAPCARGGRRRRSRVRDPCQVLRAPDGDLDLDHRLEPVDVGSLEQSDLDQSHGPEDTEAVSGTACPAWRRGAPATARCPSRRRPDRAPRYPRDDRGRPAGLPRRPGAPREHRLRQLHEGGCRRRRRLDGRAPRALGATVDDGNPTSRPRRHGDRADRGRDPDGPTLLCIGHMDTVFDPGTAAARPFAIADGIANGPGVTDMKGGLLTGLYALARDPSTCSAGCRSGASSSSPTPTRRSARRHRPRTSARSPPSRRCLVLECARANGDIVSSRKGNLGLAITVNGRAAHAGVEPEKGRSAILEAARIVTELHALNGRWPGVTVNVGVINGGTRPNVVAAVLDGGRRARGDPRRAGGGRGRHSRRAAPRP